MKYKLEPLLLEAKQIKSFMEKNKKIPTSCKLSTGEKITPYTISYLLSAAIHDKFKHPTYESINVRVYDPTKRYADTISDENVYTNDYLVMANNFISFSMKYHRVPRFVTIPNSEKVSFEAYLYAISKIANYYKQNNTLPKYCNFNKTFVEVKQTSNNTSKKTSNKSTSTKAKTVNSNIFTSNPHYYEKGCNKLGQCTPYYCGPHSIHQAIRKFNITKYSESDIAKMCGTTTSGSDHKGMLTAISKISKSTGIQLKAEWKTFSSLGKDTNSRFLALGKLISKPNIAMIGHIGYQGAGSSATGALFGHYECLDKINDTTKYVRALNSLGTKKSDGSYPGHLQDRTYNLQATFFKNTPGNQPGLLIITKI